MVFNKNVLTVIKMSIMKYNFESMYIHLICIKKKLKKVFGKHFKNSNE